MADIANVAAITTESAITPCLLILFIKMSPLLLLIQKRSQIVDRRPPWPSVEEDTKRLGKVTPRGGKIERRAIQSLAAPISWVNSHIALCQARNNL
jgi:hypothetical protein